MSKKKNPEKENQSPHLTALGWHWSFLQDGIPEECRGFERAYTVTIKFKIYVLN